MAIGVGIVGVEANGLIKVGERPVVIALLVVEVAAIAVGDIIFGLRRIASSVSEIAWSRSCFFQ
jgi:hypothetical protein